LQINHRVIASQSQRNRFEIVFASLCNPFEIDLPLRNRGVIVE
jgi:hypothetical protein